MTKKENILIINSLSKQYSCNYEEYKNKDENCIEITATMKIDLNSKAAKNKLYKAWKKDKSPLLIELQRFFREHETMKKEGKTGNYYTVKENEE